MEQLQILEEHGYARQGKMCIGPTLTEVEVRNALISENLSKQCAAIDPEGQKMLLIPQRVQIEGELFLCLKDENEFVKLLTENFNKTWMVKLIKAGSIVE